MSHPSSKSQHAHNGYCPAEIRKTPLTSIRHDFARLWLATAFDEFNSELPRFAEEQWQRDVERRAEADSDDASSALRRLRLALSLVQRRKKRDLTRTVFWLA